jgi:hypothetical protein
MPRRRVVHTLVLGLTGEAEPLAIRITKPEIKRLEHCLYLPDPKLPFFHFDSPAGAAIVISMRDVQFARVLTDRPDAVAPSRLPDRDRIEVRLRHRSPMTTGALHSHDAVTLMSRLSVGHMMGELNEFQWLRDEDEEWLYFRSDQLMYMSVPAWMIEADRKAQEAQGAAELDEIEREEAAERLLSELSANARRTNGK